MNYQSPFFWKKIEKNTRFNFCCSFPHLLGLDFCEFDNFLFLDLSLRCHETLINLFPHLIELNLAATALTDLKISKKYLCN